MRAAATCIMSGAQRTRRPSIRIQLSAKQANIYAWGWQKDARFRYAVCGRRFGKTYLGAEEMRRAYRLAVEHNIIRTTKSGTAPTFKQARRVMWNRLKRNIPEVWIHGRPKHQMRHANKDWRRPPDRGPGCAAPLSLWFSLGRREGRRQDLDRRRCGQLGRPQAARPSSSHHRVRQRGCRRCSDSSSVRR